MGDLNIHTSAVFRDTHLLQLYRKPGSSIQSHRRRYTRRQHSPWQVFEFQLVFEFQQPDQLNQLPRAMTTNLSISRASGSLSQAPSPGGKERDLAMHAASAAGIRLKPEPFKRAGAPFIRPSASLSSRLHQPGRLPCSFSFPFMSLHLTIIL